ncbi:hypothetical protein [Salinimonas lutimaris]|uniref:hypothetical protein n=1 Tax=Salinimonas lutimaris TaxID=914153 RepID=UPI0010BF8CF4|nr:hypothetical protein [Salinimonas lutimaris]
MTKRLILHIGPPKTGTSAIQKWCADHQQFLKQQGIFYPSHALSSNHISSGHAEQLIMQNQDGKRELNPEGLEAINNEFLASGCNTLLLSSEYFFYHAHEISPHFTHVQLIGYIRSPLAQFESAYNQTVKRHGQTKPLKFGRNLHTTTLDKLHQLLHTHTFDKVTLRAYLEAAEFNVVQDFVECLNLTYHVAPVTINPSYSFESLEFKRWLNQFDLATYQTEIDTILQSQQKGTVDYTLLPEELSARYTKQALQAVKLFHRDFKIHNYQILLSELSDQGTLERKEQRDDHLSLNWWGDYLYNHHRKFYRQLCKSISQQQSEPPVALFTAPRSLTDKLLRLLKH